MVTVAVAGVTVTGCVTVRVVVTGCVTVTACVTTRSVVTSRWLVTVATSVRVGVVRVTMTVLGLPATVTTRRRRTGTVKPA